MSIVKVETMDGSQAHFFDERDRLITVHRGSCMLTSIRKEDVLRLDEIFAKFTASSWSVPIWLVNLYARYSRGYKGPTYHHIDWKAHGL